MSRSFAAAVIAFLIGSMSLRAQAPPPGAALRVLVSNGLKASLEELQAAGERAAGRPLALQFSSTLALKKRIEAGEGFDVAIITVEAIADLIRQGKLAAGTRTELGRSQLGIGIRKGSPKPDIRTTSALKQTLLDAKSITYPRDGASRGFLEGIFERLGIAANLKSKIILAPGSGPATESVAEGKAAMVVTLFSEIVPVPGVEILGPLPAEFQYDIRFAGAAAAASKDSSAATRLLAFLSGPKAAPVLKAKGLEPR